MPWVPREFRQSILCALLLHVPYDYWEVPTRRSVSIRHTIDLWHSGDIDSGVRSLGRLFVSRVRYDDKGFYAADYGGSIDIDSMTWGASSTTTATT